VVCLDEERSKEEADEEETGKMGFEGPVQSNANQANAMQCNPIQSNPIDVSKIQARAAKWGERER